MMQQRRSVEVLEYNAFTERPFAGNPAGVVLDASGLSDEVMQQIACQLNLAETAFLVPSSRADADIRLRWFTPTMEVDLCGHATIASFSAAAEHGVFGVESSGVRELRVETRSGILRVRISRRNGATWVAMQLPLPRFEPLELERDAFAALWGVGADDLAGEWCVHRSLNYFYLPARDLQVLRALTLNPEKLAPIDATAAFAFFTTETVDPDAHWHLRFFAPFHGVAEDVVTGSAQGPMGVIYLDRNVNEKNDGWFEFKGEQGDMLGRPGRVGVRVRREAGQVADLEISGCAVQMLGGRIWT